MRLTDDQIKMARITYTKVVQDDFILDLIDTIEALQQENEQLQAQVARMREALESIKRLDKTEYTYYGARARNKNGELPGGGERWHTPYEIAVKALAEIDKVIGGKEDV